MNRLAAFLAMQSGAATQPGAAVDKAHSPYWAQSKASLLQSSRRRNQDSAALSDSAPKSTPRKVNQFWPNVRAWLRKPSKSGPNLLTPVLDDLIRPRMEAFLPPRDRCKWELCVWPRLNTETRRKTQLPYTDCTDVGNVEAFQEGGEIRNDRRLLLASLRGNVKQCRRYWRNETLDPELRQDKEIIMEAIRMMPDQLGRVLDGREYFCDRDVILAALCQDGRQLVKVRASKAFSSLLLDPVVVLTALRGAAPFSSSGSPFVHAPVEFQADPEFARLAIAVDGTALEFESAGLIRDRDVVMAALTLNGKGYNAELAKRISEKFSKKGFRPA